MLQLASTLTFLTAISASSNTPRHHHDSALLRPNNYQHIHEKDLLPAQLRAKKLHDTNFMKSYGNQFITASAIPLSELRKQYAASAPTAQEKKLSSNEKINHASSHHQSHLRRNLKSAQPNNFFTIGFSDNFDTCDSPYSSFGYLVNFCYANNDGSSYLYKVNKKENLLLELHFRNTACSGVPDEILNENLEGSTTWGDCVDGSQYTYFNEFPFLPYPTLGTVQTLEGSCEDGSYLNVKDAIAYNFELATNCKQDTMHIWKTVDLTGCSTTHTFLLNYFIDNQCTGPIAYQETYTVPTTCYSTYPTNDYPHPEGWFNQYYCNDPSGSTTPPAPITPSCDYPNLYIYIGNGLCEAQYNTEGCGYDGGDCCMESCSEFSSDCPTDDSNCIDPKYA